MRRRGIQVVVAALAMLTLSAPGASAEREKGLFGKGQQVAWGPITEARYVGQNAVGLGAVSSATATCPSGTQAVSGGFLAPGNSTNRLVVFESYRSSPRTWTVSGAAISANGGAVTAYANCRKTFVPITEVSSTATVASGAGQTVTPFATCPGGNVLVGGGWRSTRGPAATQFVLAQQSMSTAPLTWTIAAVNNSAGTQTVTASVYCASGVKLPKPRTETLTNSLVGAPNLSALDVLAIIDRCRAAIEKHPIAGRKKQPGASSAKRRKKKKQAGELSAGGFSTPPVGTPGNAITLITESRISGTGWLARGVNLGPPATLTVTSQGLCR